MNATGEQPRAILQRIARRVMVERGLLPDFSAEALAELGNIQPSATTDDGQIRDLRNLLWASIDNDDSRDLDQLTVAEAMPDDKIKILVAVADVDSVVKRDRPWTSMLGTTQPRSTRLPPYSRCCRRNCPPTSRRSASTRTVWRSSSKWSSARTVPSQDSDIYRACVRNRAKLAYNSVAAWLEGGAAPAAVAAVPGLDENLRLQDKAAQRMKELRQVHGALSFETLEADRYSTATRSAGWKRRSPTAPRT